ncbi:MAG: von Willebrand factor type A domain-containing protein [Fulvivirga sp.]|nr:von Willebrand factor type A domain-containing protein [Fulvivirga sp.]
MKKLGLFIVLSFVLIAMVGRETETITGRVTAEQDGSAIPGVNVVLKGTTIGTVTDLNGEYKINVPDGTGTLVFSFIGLVTQEIKIKNRKIIDVKMQSDATQLSEVVVTSRGVKRKKSALGYAVSGNNAPAEQKDMSYAVYDQENYVQHNTEEYNAINENEFRQALKKPLSTFSIDVDAASYSNVRRFLNNGQQPPKDAVRIEEMVNYFTYQYPQPMDEHPFSINTEISKAPWNEKHKLVHIGLQGKVIATDNLPPSNLVFLIDVSGSMNSANKLPLLKSAFKLLVQELRPQDKVAIAVYAGAAGLVLPSTPGSEKSTILNALNKLSAGGSTAGGAGIKLAYEVARQNFIEEGNNRVIIATDGDFNVGASSNAAMERLIEEKREEGTFLTVLGFGMGNYKDSKMEILADKGNGNYAYIDNILEAKKVLVNEFGGTLFTIAKDVKIQVEFNPAKISAYRLIGYENRMLKDEDFNNDKKDAGELGAGHTVTALYEVIPAGVKSKFNPIDELKYQENKISPEAYKTKELMTIKLRYKAPDGQKSKLISHGLIDNEVNIAQTSDNFRWSAAVAGFGMLLRDSEFKGDLTYNQVITLAKSAKGRDEEGYRTEFINLVKSCELIARK